MVESMHNRVRVIRESKGWTQQHLAEVMGVSRKTVNTIESGTLNPSTFISLKLIRALDYPFERLFWLDDADDADAQPVAAADRTVPAL